MDDLSIKFNRMIMEEIGIEVGARQRLYDQDTGALLQFEGKDLVAPGAVSGKEAQEFDPYNSNKLMNQMFTYFTGKHRKFIISNFKFFHKHSILFNHFHNSIIKTTNTTLKTLIHIIKASVIFHYFFIIRIKEIY